MNLHNKLPKFGSDPISITILFYEATWVFFKKLKLQGFTQKCDLSNQSHTEVAMLNVNAF